MPDEEALNRRLRAVERSLTDGDHEVDALRDASAMADRIEALESQLGDAEDRIAELEAVTQALRGYVGNVRSVNEDVEQRADAALAAVERLEDRLAETNGSLSENARSPVPRSAAPQRRHQSSDQPKRRHGYSPDDEDADGDESFVARVRNAF